MYLKFVSVRIFIHSAKLRINIELIFVGRDIEYNLYTIKKKLNTHVVLR